MDYRSAGVDVMAGRAFVERIRSSVESTRRPEVLGNLGGFGGFCRVPAGYRRPLLVAGTDGVGTKLELAQAHGKHHGVGIDLVAMCVNDVITSGAEPLFFLDYIATGKLSPGAMAEVVEGIAAGCRAEWLRPARGRDGRDAGVLLTGPLRPGGILCGRGGRGGIGGWPSRPGRGFDHRGGQQRGAQQWIQPRQGHS
jgi:hypothetical protein